MGGDTSQAERVCRTGTSLKRAQNREIKTKTPPMAKKRVPAMILGFDDKEAKNPIEEKRKNELRVSKLGAEDTRTQERQLKRLPENRP